ncbi:MAG: PepSY domain-containing protein [Acidobacteriota bacterium]|nr:PepSY domain-containing protein [Acidobacteriota bacterium]
MKSKLLLVMFAFLGTMLFVDDISAQSKEAAFVREARISMAEARKTALSRVPGHIEKAQLEREKGKLWYEFEIHKADNNAEVEIHIDAVSGEVGEVEQVTESGSLKEAEMFRQAKISWDDAEAAALKRVPGTIVMGELERERGKILYEFEIITADGKEVMIHIDAANGEVEQVEQD